VQQSDGNGNKNEFSYSFGNREAAEGEASREECRSNRSSDEANESQRENLPAPTQIPPSFVKNQSGLDGAVTFANAKNSEPD
jgi:hypothetical protein